MTDPLPAMIAAGRAASERSVDGPWAAGKSGVTGGYWAVTQGEVTVADLCAQEEARHIAAHPPVTTRALWDAVEALAAMLADVPQGSWDHMPATVDRATAALDRLRALAEAGR